MHAKDLFVLQALMTRVGKVIRYWTWNMRHSTSLSVDHHRCVRHSNLSTFYRKITGTDILVVLSPPSSPTVHSHCTNKIERIQQPCTCLTLLSCKERKLLSNPARGRERDEANGA